MTVHSLRSAEELQRLFLQLKSLSSVHRSRLVSEIVEHPLTQEKLRAACGMVMRRWARRHDLQADVLQEATCCFVRWLQTDRLQYVELGPDRLGGWLWSVWQNACRQAWQRCRPIWLRDTALAEMEMLEEIPERDSKNPTWDALLDEIERLSDDDLRRVMVDWSAGSTGRETAQRHGLSEATVSRLRCCGLERLRTQLCTLGAQSSNFERLDAISAAVH